MSLRQTLAVLASLAVIAGVSFAELLPAGTDWSVTDAEQEPTHIGDLEVSDTGNLLVYTDDPNTDHPPNTSGSYALNSAGTGYGDGAGHTVYFFEVTSGRYYWAKYDDATSQKLDEEYVDQT